MLQAVVGNAIHVAGVFSFFGARNLRTIKQASIMKTGPNISNIPTPAWYTLPITTLASLPCVFLMTCCKKNGVMKTVMKKNEHAEGKDHFENIFAFDDILPV